MYCPNCKNEMVKLVPLDGIVRPVTVAHCNNCGYEMTINNKAGNKLIDVIAVLTLAFSAFASIVVAEFYVIPFFWLIFYGVWYMIAKDKKEDVSDLKKSFYAIFILFFISFGVIIIF